MEKYLPYIVTVLCTVISGFISYIAATTQSKSDLQKLMKQHELDINKEREKFAMEKEKMEIEHRHHLELKQKEMENQLGTNLFATVTKEIVQSPEMRKKMRNQLQKK